MDDEQDGPALVTLVVEFASGGGVDRVAALSWANENGEEQHYLDIQERATVRQETFPGHHWIVRGKRSHEVLLRIIAQPQPVEQHFRIDCDDPRRPPPGDGFLPGNAASTDDDHEVADDTANDAGVVGAHLEAEDEETGAGVWLGKDGLHRFERVPRPAGSRRVEWKEVDVAGTEVARLWQVEARVTTRWMWWLSDAWKAATSMGHDKEFLFFSALSVAGAYKVDFALPDWIVRTTGGRLRSPLTSLAMLVFLLGVAVAAALPMQDSHVVLYNPGSRIEVRLGGRQGHSREPTNIPGRTAAWLLVCDGGFETTPQELRAQQGRKQHHVLVLAALVALLARLASALPLAS